MEQEYKLSLFEAIIINVNIILGAGLFINTTQLADKVGALGSVTYILIGILLFPLIFSIVKLLELYPEGGFYTFGKESINSFVGFICAFSYFIGKLASATLVTHIFVYLMQQSFDSIAHFNTLMLDLFILAIILIITSMGMKMGATIQRYLMVVKLFPIFFIIIAGFFYFNGQHLGLANYIWYNIPLTIPLLLHATSGFEAVCSLSKNIKNPRVNASRAVLFSYLIVIGIYSLYQLMFYAIIGPTLAEGDYSTGFASVLSYIIPQTQNLFEIAKDTLYVSIAISALSSAFGMFYSNIWNFHILAKNDHTFFSSHISKINTHGMPLFCIVLEGIIAIIYFIISNGNNTVLQQISALGVTGAYTLSVVSLFATYYKQKKSTILPTLGLINCTIFISACIYSLWVTNLYALTVFCILLSSGIIMFMCTNKQTIQTVN